MIISSSRSQVKISISSQKENRRTDTYVQYSGLLANMKETTMKMSANAMCA